MTLPPLVLLTDYETCSYIDAVYYFFRMDVIDANFTFLDLPVTYPWHPSYDNKHFCFWHLISQNYGNDKEEERIPDIRRCERIRWIAYVISNANNCERVWCWEKEVRTSRGRSTHIVLYLHEEKYMVILRRKNNRLELVTAYTKENEKGVIEDKMNNADPRALLIKQRSP